MGAITTTLWAHHPGGDNHNQSFAKSIDSGWNPPRNCIQSDLRCWALPGCDCTQLGWNRWTINELSIAATPPLPQHEEAAATVRQVAQVAQVRRWLRLVPSGPSGCDCFQVPQVVVIDSKCPRRLQLIPSGPGSCDWFQVDQVVVIVDWFQPVVIDSEWLWFSPDGLSGCDCSRLWLSPLGCDCPQLVVIVLTWLWLSLPRCVPGCDCPHPVVIVPIWLWLPLFSGPPPFLQQKDWVLTRNN
jgi:hypothetical protein